MWIWFGWNYSAHLDEDLRSELRRLYNEEIALGAAKSGEVERTRTVRKTPRRIKAADKAPAKKK
jgi:hypothetical protein